MSTCPYCAGLGVVPALVPFACPRGCPRRPIPPAPQFVVEGVQGPPWLMKLMPWLFALIPLAFVLAGLAEKRPC